jgi:hypothetical protein
MNSVSVKHVVLFSNVRLIWEPSTGSSAVMTVVVVIHAGSAHLKTIAFLSQVSVQLFYPRSMVDQQIRDGR